MTAALRTVIRSSRYTPAEWAAVKQRATSAGKPPGAFVREAALTGQVIQQPPRKISRGDRTVFELSRIGNNLNQLARAANASGRFEVEARLLDLLNDILALIGGMR